MRTSLCSVVALTVLAAASASAQSLNIVGTPTTVLPSSSYGAATGQAGSWNSVPRFPSAWGPLVDLAGGATTVSARTDGCDWGDGCTIGGFGPDVAALFWSYVNGDCNYDWPMTWIVGLRPGHYEATLYGSTCMPNPHSITVWTPSGMVGMDVSGSYNGSFASMQLGHFAFDVYTNTNTQVVITGSGLAAWCAVQLTHFEFPISYCTAKVNSLGCVPSIGSIGIPSGSAGSGFTINGSNVRNMKSGMLLYGLSGPAAIPFHGGTLCVAAHKRSVNVNSGGNPSGNDCSGVYALDFNAFAVGALGGNPHATLQIPGTAVHAQWWGRDQGFPAPDNVSLSDALHFSMRP